MEIIFYQG